MTDDSTPADQRCGTCRFWLFQDTNAGHCRRFPPEVNHASILDIRRWPTTLEKDWCGEWWLRS